VKLHSYRRVVPDSLPPHRVSAVGCAPRLSRAAWELIQDAADCSHGRSSAFGDNYRLTGTEVALAPMGKEFNGSDGLLAMAYLALSIFDLVAAWCKNAKTAGNPKTLVQPVRGVSAQDWRGSTRHQGVLLQR